MTLRRNVLIFHNAALGDFLMTWPLAMALGRMFAQSRVIYVTATQKGKLAERLIGVEYTDAEAGWHALHGEPASLAEIPSKYLRGAQLVVAFGQSKDGRFAAGVREVAGEVSIIDIAPNPPAGVHVLEHQLRQLQHLAPIESGVRQMQQLIRTKGLPSPAAGAKKLVIHPGSGSPRKNWPLASFVDVAKTAKGKGWDVEFVLGEVEREQFSAGDVQAISDVATVRSCDTLDQLCDAIVRSRVYVGNDSGPTHLAAMLGRRVIALFGPTSDAAAWAPIGPDVTVLPFESTAAIVAKRVLAK